jgi:hypothetical protein
MSGSGPVLQYASVQQGSRLCLPVDSRLAIEQTPDGFRVLARVMGKQGAIVSMLFASFVLLLYAIFTCSEILRAIHSHSLQRFPVPTAVFCAGYGGLLMVVINNTWRWTALDVSPQQLRLTRWSFFSRRSIVWEMSNLRDVAVEKVIAVSQAGERGQLRLAFHNRGPVHLFVGHEALALETAAARLQQMLEPSARET